MVHDLLHLALGLLHAIIIALVLGSLFNWGDFRTNSKG